MWFSRNAEGWDVLREGTAGRARAVPAGELGRPSRAGARFAEAVDAARAGRYDAAAGLLAGLTEDPRMRGPALDLQARILAQQGRHLEAEAAWLEALKAEPGNPAFHAALVALRKSRQPASTLRTALWRAAAVSAAIAAGAVLARGYGTLLLRLDGLDGRIAALERAVRSESRGQAAALEETDRRVTEARVAIDGLVARLDGVEAAVGASLEGSADLLRPGLEGLRGALDAASARAAASEQRVLECLNDQRKMIEDLRNQAAALKARVLTLGGIGRWGVSRPPESR
mgnify:CR=1 FL=1